MSEPEKTGLSRRLFLTRSSLTVAAAGVAGALPAMPALTNAAETEAAPATEALTGTESVEGPLVAHVTDLAAGRISIYAGEAEYQIQDSGLAAKLFRATQ